MSVQELKGSMVDLLAQVNDRNLLEQIYEVVQEIITDNLNKTGRPALDYSLFF